MAGLQLENLSCDGWKVGQDEIMMPGTDPGRVHHHRGATDSTCGACVRPFVTDDKGMLEINMMFKGSFHEQTRLWLAAGAIVLLVMGTNQYIVQRKGLLEQMVHAIQLTARHVTGRESGLVGGGDQEKACRFQMFADGDGGSVDLKLVEGRRNDLRLALNAREVQYSITFKEDRFLHSFEIA